MKRSVWSETVSLPRFDRLTSDIKTDVLIIGGGMCGLLCAYALKERGVDCVVLEGRRIASGITQNTTAKLTVQHGLIYDKLIRGAGYGKAQMYLRANMEALAEYEKLCSRIECDFEKRSAYTYSMRSRDRIEREVKAATSLGAHAFFADPSELPFGTRGAVCFPDQAQFHPLKFLSGILGGLRIYENSFVRELVPGGAVTAQGNRIRAEHVIVATHFPFLNKHGFYFVKLYQHRSYVTAFEGAPTVEGMYVDEHEKGLSYRSWGELLLVGGGGHRTGKKGRAWDALSVPHAPRAKPKYQWAAQDCMSLDGVPYIGQYSTSTPRLHVATGFCKWGMTSSMVAARLLTDEIMEKRNDYAAVFSPKRSICKPQLFVNLLETTVNLLTPVPKRCPHLGCALKWNKAEHTWDCPCHGSRFSEDGKLIDNPATGDAKWKR